MSNDAFRTETVETDAGDYTITLHSDYDAPNPLTEYDHEGFAVYVYQQGERAHLDTLDKAGDAGRALTRIMDKLGEYRASGFDADEVVRWYAKWKAITGSTWTLVDGSGYGSSQSDWWNWLVLADEQWADPAKAANSLMDDYENWAQGGYCGYVVEDAEGNHVDSLWAIDNEDYAIETATDAVKYDAAERVKQANLVGAGFVGLI